MSVTDFPAARRVRPLARALERARHQAGVSARAVAEEAAISRAHLSEIASGAANPSPEVARRIALALGEDAETLFPELPFSTHNPEARQHDR